MVKAFHQEHMITYFCGAQANVSFDMVVLDTTVFLTRSHKSKH